MSMTGNTTNCRQNQWHREEDPHNNHNTPGRQTKQSSQLSLPYQDDCKTRLTQSNALPNKEQLHNTTMGVTINQQQQKRRLRTDSSLSQEEAKMHFTCTKSSPWMLLLLKHKMLNRHRGFLAIAMYHHRETI